MHSPIVATALLEPIPRKATPPKAAALFAARAFRALFRFPTRTVRKPQAGGGLATIRSSPTGEKPHYLPPQTRGRQWWLGRSPLAPPGCAVRGYALSLLR